MDHGFPTQFWPLSRLIQLIEREVGHAFSSSYVWTLLREMGFSSQRPAGRAIQRRPKLIMAFWQQAEFGNATASCIYLKVSSSSTSGRTAVRATSVASVQDIFATHLVPKCRTVRLLRSWLSAAKYSGRARNRNERS